LYTSDIGEDCEMILKLEAARSPNLQIHPIKALLPRQSQKPKGRSFDRFKDVFTKLRIFEVFRLGFDKCVYLDADVAVFRQPDDLFNIHLPDGTWIAAAHYCVCNRDRATWAAQDWTKENCAFTPQTEPDGEATVIYEGSRPTYHALNAGVLLFHPSDILLQRLLQKFSTSQKLKEYQCPDQDFLTDCFRNQWKPVPWYYNAQKRFPYVHPLMWSDDKVVILHYICDKPWHRRIGVDGIAGDRGRDGVTHQWWWDLYNEWHELAQKDHFGIEVAQFAHALTNTLDPVEKVVPLPEWCLNVTTCI